MRKVRFSENDFYYIIDGECQIIIPKIGDFRGIRVENDFNWRHAPYITQWSLDGEKVRGFSIKTQTEGLIVYLNWSHKRRRHSSYIGSVDDIERARNYIDKINQRYI